MHVLSAVELECEEAIKPAGVVFEFDGFVVIDVDDDAFAVGGDGHFVPIAFFVDFFDEFGVRFDDPCAAEGFIETADVGFGGVDFSLEAFDGDGVINAFDTEVKAGVTFDGFETDFGGEVFELFIKDELAVSFFGCD